MSKKTNTKSIDDSTLSMHEKFTNIFLISMFSIFPLYLTNKLFSVRTDRLHYFITTTLILLFFIGATYICGIDKEKWPKKVFRPSSADCGMLMFLIVCAVSTLSSEYGKSALTGDQGRNSGLILMSVYYLCYFLISRYFKCVNWIFDIFIVTGCIICIIAILHAFYIDPFELITTIKQEQQETFITTIGNINLFSAFVCVVLPIVTALFVMSENIIKTILYGAAVSICFMGMLVANSDSGYFGLMAFLSVLLVFSAKNAKRSFRFYLSLFIMIMSGSLLRLIANHFDGRMRELDPLPHMIVYGNKIYAAAGTAGVLAIIFFILKIKMKDKDFHKAVRITAAIFVGACASLLALVFVYFSFIDKTTDLGSLTKYLRLNDQWGTHRGYAWIRSVLLFKDGGIKNMLIGTGPDTFGPVIKAVYRDDMLKRHGSVFDNAHNEYLNYLVTIGALGVVSYITVIVSVLIRSVRRCKNNVWALIAILVIISYCSQALFNLATPIVTPYIFVFLGIGEAYIRRYNEKASQNC